MPKLGSVSWIRFVKKMRQFGFSGPYQEGRHPYMIKGELSVTIPNPPAKTSALTFCEGF